MSHTSQQLPEVMENQCRVEAKEIALKAYDSCVTLKKSEHIENLRNEYQAKLLELKNEYDQKIKELVTTDESTLPSKPAQSLTKPTQTKTSKQSKKTTSINQTEPTIVLKKAKPISKSKSKAVKNNPPITEVVTTQIQKEDVLTARTEEELNSATGEFEKLEDVQEVGQ